MSFEFRTCCEAALFLRTGLISFKGAISSREEALEELRLIAMHSRWLRLRQRAQALLGQYESTPARHAQG